MWCKTLKNNLFCLSLCMFTSFQIQSSNMRGLLIFVCFAVFAVSYGQRCYSVADCKEGQCCTGGITPYIKGGCKPLAKEGELCDPQPPVAAKYFLRCPCESGLKCVGEQKVVSSTSPACRAEE